MQSLEAELGGIHEIAAMMGVSKQRVHQLTDKDWFAEPVARLKCGPVYDLEEVRESLRKHGREV